MDDSKVRVIVEAARKRFAHYGLAKTTMTEIAADIGMSKASLYYYFPDKENLFIAVMTEDFEAFTQTINSLIVKPSKASLKLKRYIGMRMELLSKLSTLSKIESPHEFEIITPVFQENRKKLLTKEKELVARIFELGITDREFIKFNVALYSDLFIAALAGIRAQNFGLSFQLDSDGEQKTKQRELLMVSIFLKSIQKAQASTIAA